MVSGVMRRSPYGAGHFFPVPCRRCAGLFWSAVARHRFGCLASWIRGSDPALATHPRFQASTAVSSRRTPKKRPEGSLLMNPEERRLLESLDAALRSHAVRAQIDPIVERAAQKL